MRNKPYVIALEGIDGAGKSTIVDLLRKNIPSSLYQRTEKSRCIDNLVSSKFMQHHYMLQVPLYLLLSYKNYIKFLVTNRQSTKQLIIMDRCFLSNICYFYPTALNNVKLLKWLMRFEIKLLPHSIFVLDVDSEVGRIRDKEKKDLKWLEKTRKAYLDSEVSPLLSQYKIQILEESMTIDEKYQIIFNHIRRNVKW
jgi:thymidylate kinase